MITAYRGVRLPEVAGLPPVSNSPEGFPTSVSSHLLKEAAEAIASFNPELSVRLAIRVATYDGDETLERVLSRVQIANMSQESLTRLAQMCIDVIRFSLPFMSQSETETYRGGMSPVDRLCVGIEALSRLVVRLDQETLDEAFEVSVQCYKSREVVQNFLLGQPLQNLIRRVWPSLPMSSRRARVFDLLTLPIVGTAGFAEESQSTDPGSYVAKDDLQPKRTNEIEDCYSEAIAVALDALREGIESRSRAILRLIPLVLAGSLTDAEKNDIAEALWGDRDPVIQNPRTNGSVYDWVFLILPEPEFGIAERSFRLKWLTAGQGDREIDAMYASNVLSQVSMAISGLKGINKPFDLSQDEIEHIIDQIGRIIEMFSSGSVKMDLGFSSRVRNIGPLIAKSEVRETVASYWFSKAELFLSQPKPQTRSMFDSLARMRTALGFALLPGLIKSMPNKLSEISDWITQGVTSPDETTNREAIHVLRTWVMAASNADLPPVPSDLVNQVGTVISSGRTSGLADALLFGELVFDRGSKSSQDAIGPFVLIGLKHLAEQLRYDREQSDGLENIHTLRLLCVRLSSKLARHGLYEDSTVRNWLNIGENDPFPEIRNVLTVGN